jgi:UDP-N-acetylmuramyl-tripeptide synthetase/UDP-N-acetylmuramoyl-tripeptide--D-alanyl-D-alanine ligase
MMTLAELAGTAGFDAGSAGGAPVVAVTADSRNVKPGTLFVALKGAKTDGASFAGDAARKGAVAIVCAPDAPIEDLATPVIRVEDPHHALALIAAALAGSQPETIVAVTGTSGKTSVAAFTRQIFAQCGFKAASLGTVGVVSPDITEEGALTTPDPVDLHATLKALAATGVTHAAMEASSHGLDQRRLDGVRLAAAGFTNLGRDHLDYHPDMDAYFRAKMRLFDTLLGPGKPAVIFADDAWSGRATDAALAAGCDVRTVGRRGTYLRLLRVEHHRTHQRAEIEFEGRIHEVDLPLAGDFQLWNVLVAAGLALSVGAPASGVFAALETLQGASGRLDLAGTTDVGAPVYVDYAHKPEALENVLKSVRPFTSGRIVLVFGCGGDRDKGKRPIMGGIASRLADIVIVTDDNPRSEEPSAIRAEIMDGAPGALEIGDRAEAIRHAVNLLRQGDTLIVAGKGHELGQKTGDVVLPFSDHEEVRKAIAETKGRTLLWSIGDLIEAMGARPLGAMPAGVTGISIDSRTVEEGEAFFAIKGDTFDGHSFVTGALKAGAAVLVVAEAKLPALGRVHAPLLVVDDPFKALYRLAAAARARSSAQIIAVTGSVGKTTTKEALRVVLAADGTVHASVKSFNNHWGVPLSLTRLPPDSRFAVFEIGMSGFDEIRPLVKLVQPHISIITRIAPAHLGNFNSIDEIAKAKAEIFEGVVPGGYAVINRDDTYFDYHLTVARECGIDHVKSFGQHADADYRLSELDAGPDGSTGVITIRGESHPVTIGAPGEHIAQNMLAVIASAHLAGSDLGKALSALADVRAAAGRGARETLTTEKGDFGLIDESYNANPVSMAAAIRLLGSARLGKNGRRIAILGDMRELGPEADAMHAALAPELEKAGVNLALLVGGHMRALKDAMPAAIKVQHFSDIDALAAAALGAVRAGDVVMVKSSNGTGTAKVVAALKDKYAPRR